MNIYTYSFTSKCPNNGVAISYNLEILSNNVIMVEDIVEACRVDSTYHEELADKLYLKFGGKQTIRAFHHGVWIETRRHNEQ